MLHWSRVVVLLFQRNLTVMTCPCHVLLHLWTLGSSFYPHHFPYQLLAVDNSIFEVICRGVGRVTSFVFWFMSQVLRTGTNKQSSLPAWGRSLPGSKASSLWAFICPHTACDHALCNRDIHTRGRQHLHLTSRLHDALARWA